MRVLNVAELTMVKSVVYMDCCSMILGQQA